MLGLALVGVSLPRARSNEAVSVPPDEAPLEKGAHAGGDRRRGLRLVFGPRWQRLVESIAWCWRSKPAAAASDR